MVQWYSFVYGNAGRMASEEREPVTGIWGRTPAMSRGIAPQGSGAKPPGAESFLALGCLMKWTA